MSLTKLLLGKLFPVRESLVRDIPATLFYSVDVPRGYHRKGLGLVMLYVLTFISLILKFSKRTLKFLSRAIYLIMCNEKYALVGRLRVWNSFVLLAGANLMKNLPNSSTNRILKPMRTFAILHTILQAKQNQSFNFSLDRIEWENNCLTLLPYRDCLTGRILSFEDMYSVTVYGHWSVLGLNRGRGQLLNF